MTNTLGVCVCSVFLLIFANSVAARQLPKECAKGPDYWCQNLKNAADCGAVGHCIGTVWDKQDVDVRQNEISGKFLVFFRQLKDVAGLINEDYLATRLSAACRGIQYPAAAKICKENTAHFEKYIFHILSTDVSAETLCQVVGMCNNLKVESAVAANKKKLGHDEKKETLLGSSQCTWGPSYWCSNFSTGRQCKATHHCVERVWSRMTFPVDTDSVCKICTDMVTQARDQLESNETQEELKQVFEGSCQLIPIKLISKECMKLADEFIPELVETLASQMNPQAVCSVAGLCNNARIDELLEAYNTELQLRTDCSNCHQTVGVLRKRFDQSTYDEFLVSLLQVCRNAGSLSDSCSMLVFKYYENIQEAVKKDLTPKSVCHLSGQCNYMFHTHDGFTFPEKAPVSDDVPCEFCEQLIKHLRDVLVANTTEVEFHKILDGLCHQSGKFAAECKSLVDEYYPIIYTYLVVELDGKSICTMMGVCGKRVDVPIAPLLPRELSVKAITPSPVRLIGTYEANSYKVKGLGRVPVSSKQANVRIMGSDLDLPPPLPVERMLVSMPQGKKACSFCQYFLHYLQVELSDTRTEDEIKDAVSKACDRLPQSVSSECKQFVTEYGPSVIALLVQEIDPASVCPGLGLCAQTEEVRKVSINSDKSNCPLCLFAVEQLESILQNNRSEASIRKALDGLCNHLSAKLSPQCVDFVDTYSNQLVEMIIANLNAQEICVYLTLCKDEVKDPLKITHQSIDKFFEKPQLMGDRNNHKISVLPKHMLEGDIETNEIPDNTVNGLPVKQKVSQKPLCVICEYVMKEFDDEIKDKHNEDEIKRIVHNVCKHMPKSVRGDCDQFVEKYADLVISLLAQELEPAEVCQQLKLCNPTSMDHVKLEVLDCAVCETVVMAVKKVITNDKLDHNIVHIVEKSCGILPAKYSARCHTLMEIYGSSIIQLIEEYSSKNICQKIGLCAQTGNFVNMYSEKH